MHRTLGKPPVNFLLGLEKGSLSGLGGYFVDTQSHDTSRFWYEPIIACRRARSNTGLPHANLGFFRSDPFPRHASRLPPDAPGPPMKNEAPRERRPFGGSEQRLQIALDFFGIRLARESQTPCHPPHVRIHHEPGLAEYVAEQHVGGLAADARQRDQVFHPGRNLAAEALQDCARRSLERARLLAKEAGVENQVLDTRGGRGVHRAQVGKLGKQPRRHLIYALVSALRGENRRDQALPRVLEVETDASLGIETSQRRGKPRGTLDEILARLARHLDCFSASIAAPQRGRPASQAARDYTP